MSERKGGEQVKYGKRKRAIHIEYNLVSGICRNFFFLLSNNIYLLSLTVPFRFASKWKCAVKRRHQHIYTHTRTHILTRAYVGNEQEKHVMATQSAEYNRYVGLCRLQSSDSLGGSKKKRKKCDTKQTKQNKATK